MKERRHIIFFGNVQGVGFRYKAKHSAGIYRVTGWVRNLYNGSVEMEAEGNPRDIDALVRALKDHSWGYVERIESENIPVTEGYGFDIR